MNFDFLIDYMIPPGGYHSIELTVNWQFDQWFPSDFVRWSTLDKSVHGLIHLYDPPEQGFKSLIDYIKSLAYKQFGASIVQGMRCTDIIVQSTSIWIKYSDESYGEFGSELFKSAYNALNEKRKFKYERRKSMPVDMDRYTSMLYAFNEFHAVKTIDLKIKKVIFNDPATIVFWTDGTKTVVKCHGDDIFDPEKGLAMAVSKKVFGNNYKAYGRFKKWLPKEYEHSEEIEPDDLAKACSKFGKAVADGFKKAVDDPMG